MYLSDAVAAAEGVALRCNHCGALTSRGEDLWAIWTPNRSRYAMVCSDCVLGRPYRTQIRKEGAAGGLH